MNHSGLFHTDLGDPSSWCDSACERCPLLRGCQVGQVVARRLHRMNREDPPPTLIATLSHDLDRALVMLEVAAEQEGIDPALVGPLPVPPLVARAQALGRELVHAAAALTDAAARAGRLDDTLSSRLVGNSTVVTVKVVRLAWELGDPTGLPEPGGLLDPILLLIERASADLRRAARVLAPFVPRLRTTRFTAAHGAMIDFVTPWIARISPAARAELQARIAAGCAPSPFCRRRPEGGARA
jgi:hypothetical protein